MKANQSTAASPAKPTTVAHNATRRRRPALRCTDTSDPSSSGPGLVSLTRAICRTCRRRNVLDERIFAMVYHVMPTSQTAPMTTTTSGTAGSWSTSRPPSGGRG